MSAARPLNSDLTPWSRAALSAAGLTQSEIASRLPAGWRLTGSARSDHGPWTFGLLNDSEDVRPFRRETTVYRVADVREAIAGLVAAVTPDLELQLRASLAFIEGKG